MSARHLYVHVPFCARRCSYCDFAIAVRRVPPVAAYLDALADELRIRALGGDTLATVYLGGGTPSLLGGAGVAQLLDLVRHQFAVEAMAEITLEVNPEDVTAEVAAQWRVAGVTRVSLGVQSFHEPVLRWMHRVHSAETAERAATTLRDAGIGELSVDLIFAVPAALERDWNRDVAQVLELAPSHVSLYGLTVEPGTPLQRWVARGEASEAPEERYEREFLHAHHSFSAHGFEHYEVSNYGLRGHHAIHNSAYWRGVPYLGIGPSAHGFTGSERRWNEREYSSWLRALAAGRDPLGGAEILTAENRSAESVYLGLRTYEGLPLLPAEHAIVAPWLAAGWGTMAADGRFVCTPTGWLRLDALAAALTVHRSP